jgi:hypothetical protein
VLLVVKWAAASVITHGAGLPPADRSSNRNEQHRAALGHHPANAACPRRTARSQTCLHLLIAGSPPSQRNRDRPNGKSSSHNCAELPDSAAEPDSTTLGVRSVRFRFGTWHNAVV